IQFSFMPNLRKLQTLFTQTRTESKVTIGIFHDKANPKDLYPDARVSALCEEGRRQGVSLLYFSCENVDLHYKIVHDKVYSDGKWTTVEADFPDVINNTGTSNRHQQSVTERKLRRMIPFTSFHVGNKFYLPKVLVKNRQYADLLVPFKMVRNKKIVYDY